MIFLFKYFLSFVLILTVTITHAQQSFSWRKFYDECDSATYIDFNFIKVNGNLRKFFNLEDFYLKQLSSNPNPLLRDYLSFITENEIDCWNNTTRTLSEYYYSTRMAQGKPDFSHTNVSAWSQVDRVIASYACEKRLPPPTIQKTCSQETLDRINGVVRPKDPEYDRPLFKGFK